MAAALTGGLPGQGQAGERTFAFDIPADRLRSELALLAVQADISISTSGIETCAPRGRPLKGRYSLRDGLEHVLGGSGCGYRFLDPRAVLIQPLPQPQPVSRPPITPPSRPAPPITTPVAEVTVAATRRPTPVDRSAYPVSTLSGALLDEQGISDVADIASLTPSMTVTNLGPGRDKILLRGLSDGPLTGRTQSMVGLYLDGVRLTGDAPDPDLMLVDMADAEVLRGPQGALYGSGSLGGVLQLVTRRPDAGALSGWLSVRAGLTEGGAPSDTLEGMANIPLIADRVALRVVAYREHLGGYIDNARLGGRDLNGVRRQGERIALQAQLNDRWTLRTGLVSQGIETRDSQYGERGLKPYTQRNFIAEPHDNDFSELYSSLHGDLGWAALDWTVSGISHRLNSRYDATILPPVPMPAGASAFDDHNDIAILTSEASLASPAGARVSWLAGLFAAHTRQSEDLKLSSVAAPAVIGFTEARRDHLDEAAVYGEADFPLMAGFHLTAGGRLFFTRGQVRSVIAAPLSATGSAYGGRYSRTGFAPKLLLSYRPSDTLMIYVAAAEGYRAGGINTTGVPGQVFSDAGGVEPNRRYQSDELWSYEAGVRISLLSGRLNLRGAAFDARWSNIQSDQLLPSGLPFTANIGDGQNRGLELEGGYREGPLSLRGSLLLNLPELDHANPAFPARGDLGLAGVPERTWTVAAGYEWPLPAGMTLRLDGRYSYVGRSHLTFDAVTSPQMGGYGDGRLAATLGAARWSLTAAVDNPADGRGDTFAYGNPFTLRIAQQTTPQRPRTFSVTIKAAF
jgi:outer membrane receptor protein involved in Fe transport